MNNCSVFFLLGEHFNTMEAFGVYVLVKLHVHLEPDVTSF